MQILLYIFLLVIVFLPFILTALNGITFLIFITKRIEKKFFKVIEVISIFLGVLYLFFYIYLINNSYEPWYEQIYSFQFHSIISQEHFLTILVLSILSFLGYMFIRFVPVKKQTPIISALAIATIYIGIVICTLWCIQTITNFLVLLFPANCILIFIKTIYAFVYEKDKLIKDNEISLKCGKLSKFLNNALNYPWIAVLLLVPLLGIMVTILFLFGQEPSSIIKAWTQTADWTFSQKIPPESIPYDSHYLCTVAAKGHRNIVKPIRTGLRHGHRVVVNRQLCIANAFEQVL
ncbi:MAG: DUF6688 family protein, partial [Oscillospiraceae bacterium]